MIAIRTEFIGLMIIVVLALGIMFMPGLSMAEQIEPTVSCNEGSEPVGISYGDRTTDCDIDPPTDLDRFEFCGTAGDEVRLNVFAATDPMDPLVEIWDSVATVLAQASCGGLCTVAVDITLPANDCYTIFVSDVNTDEIGDYTLQLERIQPVPGSAVELIYDTPVAEYYRFGNRH